MYLADEAAEQYLSASRDAYSMGLISWGSICHRFLALRALCDPESAAGRRTEQLLLLERQDLLPEDWRDAGELQDPAMEPWEGDVGAVGVRPGHQQHYVEFVPGPQTGMGNWVFNLADADFHPSVPHGHSKQEYRRKLDCYTGWIYVQGRQVGRESSEKVARLWNDDQFRQAALRAIAYYTQHFPDYSGWRVQDPFRLPRRRW